MEEKNMVDRVSLWAATLIHHKNNELMRHLLLYHSSFKLTVAFISRFDTNEINNFIIKILFYLDNWEIKLNIIIIIIFKYPCALTKHRAMKAYWGVDV
jgi:hypothetical protein